MMQHFQDNQLAVISYVLFAHFPNPPAGYAVKKVDLEAALGSKNKDLKKYSDALTGKIDLDKFLDKFTMEFAPSWDDIRHRKEFDGYDPANWPAMIEWLTKHVKRLENAFGGRLKPLGQKLKAEFNSSGAFQEEVEG